MQTRYALGLTSGSAALQTAVAALGIGPGDEVILPAGPGTPVSMPWCWLAPLPVFAEIDESFNIDPKDSKAKSLSDKLIMAVHLQGIRPTWTPSWRCP